MATAPRYAGATVAEAVAYAQELLEDDFLRVFDRDGDGAVASGSADERAFIRAVCSAETEIDEALAISQGAPVVATVGNPIPDSLREISILRSLWCAVRTRLTMSDTEKAPYRTLYKDTDARLAKIQRDSGARIPGRGAPEPVRSVISSEGTGSGSSEGTFQDLADGTSWGGF